MTALVQNAATMCASMSCADFISQHIATHFRKQKHASHEKGHQPAAIAIDWDENRTLKMGAVGLFIQGPLFHLMYTAADRVCGAKPAFSTVLKKTAFTTAFAPFHLSALFMSVALLNNGGDLAAAATKVRDDVPAVYLAGMAYWPAFNILNFHYISAPATRVKAAAFAGVLWNIFLTYKANKQSQID